MRRFELIAPFAEASDATAERLCWPSPGHATQIRTGLDWALSDYGTVPTIVTDLLHMAAGAYLADLRTARPVSFSRVIDLTVQVQHPDVWASDAGEDLVDLLAWISGDEWTLRPVPIGKGAVVDRADQPLVEAQPRRDQVMLLSGGLDSFCGAVDQLPTVGTRLHIGHSDAATSVRHAQREIGAWLTGVRTDFTWQRHELGTAEGKRESTTRTRSFLFMAMAIAAASGTGAKRVVVPENGFTSMNVPLIPSRGGALSTKSTHPWTFQLLRTLLGHAAIAVEVSNPYVSLTKGELLQKVAGLVDGFIDATAHTLSCAKLDAGRFKKADGGNPNINCGLCYACLVRRGAYQAARITDPTDYLVHRLKGSARQDLYRKRYDDIWALDLAEKRGFTEDDLIASAAWPLGTDFSEVMDLVARGRQELFSVKR